MLRAQNTGDKAHVQAAADRLFVELGARHFIRIEEQGLLRNPDVASLVLTKLDLARAANAINFAKLRMEEHDPAKLKVLAEQEQERDELIADMQVYVSTIYSTGEPKLLRQVYM